MATFGAFGFSPAHAGDLYFNPSLGSGSWFGADFWNDTGFSDPFDQNWVDGSIANFNHGGIVQREIGSTDVEVAGIVNTGATLWIASNAGASVIFDGGSTSGGLEFRGSANLSGTLTHTSGLLNWNSTGGFTGTMTNAGGSIVVNQDMVSPSSNFVISSGSATYQNSSVITNGGHVTVNGGELFIGTFNSGAVSATINSLQGSGGMVAPRLGNVDSIDTLIIEQTIDTIYTGNVTGVQTFSGGTTYLTLTKSGSGTLTLGGATINLRQGTTVDGGILLVDGGPTRNFEDLSGSTAITVADGGTLGGAATFSIFGGDNVVVEAGGALAPGNGIGAIGSTIFAFQAGGILDLTSATSGNGWLHFDLGADTSPGATYDQLVVTGGGLDIGNGFLAFDDFDFNVLAGFAPGSYTLFESSNLLGSLSGNIAGMVGGHPGSLSLQGNNLFLTVVPEPSGAALALVGLMLATAWRGRKKRSAS